MPTGYAGFLLTLFVQISRSVEANTWREVTDYSGSPPTARYHHSAVWATNVTLIFGGLVGSNLNDLHAYDSQANTWQEVTDYSGSPPTVRYSHSAVWATNVMLIFGGSCGHNCRLNDLHAYDPQANTWQEVTDYSGSPPTARRSHSAVWATNAMLIFGGYDGSSSLNDLHAYDPETTTTTTTTSSFTSTSSKSTSITTTTSETTMTTTSSTSTSSSSSSTSSSSTSTSSSSTSTSFSTSTFSSTTTTQTSTTTTTRTITWTSTSQTSTTTMTTSSSITSSSSLTKTATKTTSTSLTDSTSSQTITTSTSSTATTSSQTSTTTMTTSSSITSSSSLTKTATKTTSTSLTDSTSSQGPVVRGSLSFILSGVIATQVEEAVRSVLLSVLNIDEAWLMIEVTSRRLFAARRLAPSWTVTYSAYSALVDCAAISVLDGTGVETFQVLLQESFTKIGVDATLLSFQSFEPDLESAKPCTTSTVTLSTLTLVTSTATMTWTVGFTAGSGTAAEATKEIQRLEEVQENAMSKVYEELQNHSLEISIQTRLVLALEDEGPEGQPITSFAFQRGNGSDTPLFELNVQDVSISLPASAIEEMGSDANKPVVVVSIMIITQETAAFHLMANASKASNQDLITEPVKVAFSGESNSNRSDPSTVTFPPDSSKNSSDEVVCVDWDEEKNDWAELENAEPVQLPDGRLGCAVAYDELQTASALAITTKSPSIPEEILETIESVLACYGASIAAVLCLLVFTLVICILLDSRIQKLGVRCRHLHAIDRKVLISRFSALSCLWGLFLLLGWLAWALNVGEWNDSWSLQPPYNLFWLATLMNHILLSAVAFLVLWRWSSLRSRKDRSLFDVMELVLFLLDADIRLVRVEFLLELHDTNRLWSRRQEAQFLKTENGLSALVSHGEMFAWALAMQKSPKMQRIIALSHCWESQQHPDPWGCQLEVLAHALKPIWRSDPDFAPGVFIDFMSLYQFERHGKHQTRSFDLAMKGMHRIYAHEWSYTFFITELTPVTRKIAKRENLIQVFWKADGALKYVRAEDLMENSTPYDQRGWCVAETQWSALRVLNTFGIFANAFYLFARQEEYRCKAPMHSQTFRNTLSKSHITFTHRSDFLPLIAAQKEAFEEKARQCKVLRLQDLPPEQVEILGDALQAYVALEELHLHRCAVNVSGLFQRLGFLASLKRISLQQCWIGDDEVQAIADVMSLSKWKCLNLSENFISTEGALCLVRVLQGKQEPLDELCLRGNIIGQEGLDALDGLAISHLDLTGNVERASVDVESLSNLAERSDLKCAAEESELSASSAGHGQILREPV